VNAADERIYDWIRTTLDSVKKPYRVIPGNHDSSTTLTRSFSLDRYFKPEEKELYWREESEHHSFYFMDSSRGDFSDTQLNWLAENLQKEIKQPLVFMHHPPVFLSVPLMDDRNFPAPDTQRFLGCIGKSKLRPNVFVGHYHVDKVAVVEEAIIWACPSTFYQMSQLTEEFSIDHYRPGYRLIELSPLKVICSTHYLSEPALVVSGNS
jgi:hypothetical protein